MNVLIHNHRKFEAFTYNKFKKERKNKKINSEKCFGIKIYEDYYNSSLNEIKFYQDEKIQKLKKNKKVIKLISIIDNSIKNIHYYTKYEVLS